MGGGEKEMRKEASAGFGRVCVLLSFFFMFYNSLSTVTANPRSSLQDGPDEGVGLCDVDDGPPA